MRVSRMAWVLLVVSCGEPVGNSLSCGEGTVEIGGECAVADDEEADPYASCDGKSGDELRCCTCKIDGGYYCSSSTGHSPQCYDDACDPWREDVYQCF